MNITAKVNDRNDISQANRKLISISQGIKLSKHIFVAKDIQQWLYIKWNTWKASIASNKKISKLHSSIECPSFCM